MSEIKQNITNELSEEELENIAGGFGHPAGGKQPDFGRSGQGTFDLPGGFSDSWVGSYRLSALSLRPLGAYFGRRDRTASFRLPPSHGGGKHWQPSSWPADARGDRRPESAVPQSGGAVGKDSESGRLMGVGGGNRENSRSRPPKTVPTKELLCHRRGVGCGLLFLLCG